MSKNIIFLLVCLVFIFSCSKDNEKVGPALGEQDVEDQMIVAYKEGKKALAEGDAIFASKKFNEAEMLFPQSNWAPRASLMSAYALYSEDLFDDAIFNLERHIVHYPTDKNLGYAHYLIAICYFEQLYDEKRDLGPLQEARSKFEYILENYPETDFSIDAKFKLGLIIDQLAAKEMYVGRYYMKTERCI